MSTASEGQSPRTSRTRRTGSGVQGAPQGGSRRRAVQGDSGTASSVNGASPTVESIPKRRSKSGSAGELKLTPELARRQQTRPANGISSTPAEATRASWRQPGQRRAKAAKPVTTGYDPAKHGAQAVQETAAARAQGSQKPRTGAQIPAGDRSPRGMTVSGAKKNKKGKKK